MINKKFLFSIDPGTTQSGVCLVRKTDLRPLASAKVKNEEVGRWLSHEMTDHQLHFKDMDFCIERIQGNGYAVSSDVFVTCEWVGRYTHEYGILFGIGDKKGYFDPYVYRREEYKNLCGNIYSHNDKGIRQSLVDRFAYGEPNFGKGTKANKGWFFGFSADSWSAYAVAVTFIDREAKDYETVFGKSEDDE